MKTMIAQLGALLLLMAVCGVAYNAVHSKDPEKYLPWTGGEKIYDKYATGTQPAASAGAPAPVQPPGQASPPAAAPAPSQAPSQPGAQAAPGPAAQAPAQAPSEFRMIAIKEAIEELDSGTIFIDARRTREYEQGHIPGAVCICPYEQATFFDKLGKLRENAVLEAPVVVYCTNSNECESSKMVSSQLKEAGFVNILIYEGGFPEWQKEQPDKIVKGSEPGKWNP
jgi:rhodanese-related sulfurtransferase